jgi:hypothetical protein
MFAGFFLWLLPGGFHGLNTWDLVGTGFAAAVFLSQSAWPQLWESLTGRVSHENDAERSVSQ